MKTDRETRTERYTEVKSLILQLAQADNPKARESLKSSLNKLDIRRNDKVHRTIKDFSRPDNLRLFPTTVELRSLLKSLSGLELTGLTDYQIEQKLAPIIWRIRFNNSSENGHGQIRRLSRNHSSFRSRVAQQGYVNLFYSIKRRRNPLLYTLDRFLSA